MAAGHRREQNPRRTGALRTRAAQPAYLLAAVREVLAQRRIGRLLCSALRSPAERDRLRGSILAAIQSEPLPRLRARVLTETMESGVAQRAPKLRPVIFAWAPVAAAACVAV